MQERTPAINTVSAMQNTINPLLEVINKNATDGKGSYHNGDSDKFKKVVKDTANGKFDKYQSRIDKIALKYKSKASA